MFPSSYTPAIGPRPLTSGDDDLVEHAQRGDRSALDELLGRHYDRIYAICRRLAGNDADAADACQEALMAIVRGLPTFQGTSTFKTWSHRVATNACLDELRRRQRRPLAVVEEPERISDDPELDVQVTDRLTIDDALPQLPEEFRAPVVLRDVVGMDYREIAEALNLPPGTVRSRISRGRRQLAQLLGNQTPDRERQSSNDLPPTPPRTPPPSTRPRRHD